MMAIICVITPSLFPELVARGYSTVNGKRLKKTQKLIDPNVKQVSMWATHQSLEEEYRVCPGLANFWMSADR